MAREAPGGGADREEERPLPTRLSALIREVVAVPEEGRARTPGWEQVLHPGAVVGRFELVRELGRGGFGVVYEARDRAQGRLVAFKAVLPGRAADEAFEALQREAEALGRLRHPNVVELLDAGRGEHGPWLLMELLRGQTLSARLALGPMPVLEAVRVATEVARGLAHAHGQGVVHRDLSPRNVYLCHDGQVKLLDLGLAHVFGRRRVAGGTPSYVAPEQWRGAPEDERTDVFSLGVMLFRMLSGEHPTPAEGGTRAWPVPRVEVEGAPALAPLVERMLARDPVERPRDAGEVLRALEALRGEIERSPATASSVPRLRRPLAPRARRALAAAAGAFALAVAVAAGASGWRAWQAAHRAPPSVAVLPFDDLSPEPDPTNFAAGLSEEIQGALGALPGLRVPGRVSAAALKRRGAPLAEIGRALGVEAVLEGSVRRQGRRLKVVAAVVDVADGTRRWGRTFERELTDAFEVQEEIAAAVVQALDVKLVQAEGRVGKERPAPRPEAYERYLAAKEELRGRRLGWPARAVAELERAVAMDSAFAPAWAALAVARSMQARDARASGRLPSPEAELAVRREAVAAAERAVALDPGHADGWAARGLLRHDLDYDLRGARDDLERARALSPNEPAIRSRYAALLRASGQHQDAIRESRAAAELDPLAGWWAGLGNSYLAAGDLARAEEAFRRHLATTPDGVLARPQLAWALLAQGKGEAAREVMDGFQDGEGTAAFTEAAIEQSLGHAERARALADEYVRRQGDRSEFEAAALLAFTGRRDEAFAWLRRALEARRPAIFTVLGWWPFLRPLHEDPRFAALQREVEAIGEAAARARAP